MKYERLSAASPTYLSGNCLCPECMERHIHCKCYDDIEIDEGDE